LLADAGWREQEQLEKQQREHNAPAMSPTEFGWPASARVVVLDVSRIQDVAVHDELISVLRHCGEIRPYPRQALFGGPDDIRVGRCSLPADAERTADGICLAGQAEQDSGGAAQQSWADRGSKELNGCYRKRSVLARGYLVLRIPISPKVWFVKHRTDSPAQGMAVAIVGSRHGTHCSSRCWRGLGFLGLSIAQLEQRLKLFLI
jgi:hypothetical protein